MTLFQSIVHHVIQAIIVFVCLLISVLFCGVVLTIVEVRHTCTIIKNIHFDQSLKVPLFELCWLSEYEI